MVGTIFGILHTPFHSFRTLQFEISPVGKILFLHSRRVNSLAVLGLITTEAVGEGEADGAEAGVFAAQVLVCPMILGSDHHCLEEVWS